MTSNMRLAALAAAFSAAALLSACTSTPGNSPGDANLLTYRSHLDQLRRAVPTQATTFPAALSGEYLQLGEYETQWGDWTNADHFARKGLVAASGRAPAPDDVSLRPIPPAKQGELAGARQRLLTALDGSARDRAPLIAARAQSRYDCWLEQQAENWQVDDIATCRGQFLAAMNELEGQLRPVAAPGAREYRVYFDWDRADLTPEAQQIINQVAQGLAGGAAARLELVGKADRSGPEAYNQRLSERRARTVNDALVRAGVPRDRITARGVGETQPPVPTPDGVREPRNRVVEITVR
ncbi:MAG: OmpA family protein [Rhodospirillales bacterium]|nr:OmpA family protein [Rhodospirillales bacterium]